MILAKWDYKVVTIVVLLIGVMLYTTFIGFKPYERFTSPAAPFSAPMLPNIQNVTLNNVGPKGESLTMTIEGFVPYNSTDVGNFQTSLVKLDQLSLETLFKRLIDEDAGNIDIQNLNSMREQPHSADQSRAYINSILARINNSSNRKFHILDVQGVYKQTSVDTKNQWFVDKWTAELFIQEKDSRKVHSTAMNIRTEFYTRGNKLMITKLNFMTDYFYKDPLVDGMNVYDKYFRIKNPFSLQQPFFTSEDKVLLDDNATDVILTDYHKDLRTPKYRCFQENGEDKSAQTSESCGVVNGHWDKPVINDSECPFFMANPHYPNKLGGVNKDSNRCDMPVGTKTIGYRFISNDPAHKPWCYNCHIGADGMPGSIGPCCDEQRNMELYPELGGRPDYAFQGDALERGQNWQLLADRGLNWMANPTKTKDILNPKQKQPIFNAFISPGPGELH